MPVPDKGGREMYYEKDGRKHDAELHAAMLDNPEAEKRTAERAIKRAMKERGMDLATATELYGYRP